MWYRIYIEGGTLDNKSTRRDVRGSPRLNRRRESVRIMLVPLHFMMNFRAFILAMD